MRYQLAVTRWRVILTTALFVVCGASASAMVGSAQAAARKPISRLSIAVAATFIESDDPSNSSGSPVVFETTEPLLAYTPRINGVVGKVVPGLAVAVPKPTNGGKTYEFHLKPGIKYSNGQPIEASDFKYGIERLFLNNDYPIEKFNLLKGAAAYEKTKKGSISGIIANNAAGTITFKLTAPMATFPAVMAQYFTAPVPASAPTTYDNQLPSSGPMMLTSFNAGQSFTLVKNPYYTPSEGVPASNVDTIVATVVTNPNVALAETLSGTYDYDDENVPADELKTTLAKDADQTVSVALPETNMFSLNTTKKPFNNVLVRKAVNYAINRTAMAKLSGGLQLPTENILPPTESSYRKITAYTYDVAKAKALVQKAGATGDKVTVLASGDPTSEPDTVYLVGQLKAIGLVPKLRVAPASAFFNIPSVPKTDPDVSWYPWNELIPDGSDWIGQILDGRLINKSHSNDWSLFNNPQINKQITAAEALRLGTAARNKAWAALDRELVVQQAAVVPYGNPIQVAVFSTRMNTHCYTQFVSGGVLLSNLCAK